MRKIIKKTSICQLFIFFVVCITQVSAENCCCIGLNNSCFDFPSESACALATNGQGFFQADYQCVSANQPKCVKKFGSGTLSCTESNGELTCLFYKKVPAMGHYFLIILCLFLGLMVIFRTKLLLRQS